MEIYKDSPASKAGLQVGDVIIAVDGVDVKGLYGDDLSSYIRGEIGTSVEITVLRNEEEFRYPVVRDTIDLPSVTKDIISYDGKKIGYLQISAFASNTYTQFKKALSKLEKKGIEALIIDVRDNPGGHLQQTSQILSLFFNKKTVLYQIESKGEKEKIYSSTNESRTYPIAILVNSISASASEILASCFQERYPKSILVGTNTYGKGTVQKSLSLKSGNTIKYTTEKWLTSKGKWIDNNGITPDIKIWQTEEYYDNPSYETDAILQEALKALKESN